MDKYNLLEGLRRAARGADQNAPSQADPVAMPRCALLSRCEACGNRGYVVEAKGALAVASICQCVASCPACYGKARITSGNDSKACRLPAPNVIANLINATRIPARYADASLERFQNHSGNGRAFVQWLRKWQASFKPRGGRGLVISGSVGVGKTYLLAALARELAEQGLTVRFTDFFQLVGDLKAGFDDKKAEATQLQPLIDVDVLLIDELGKGRSNEFEHTVVDQLVHERYKQNKTIIATTNYHLEDVKLAHMQQDFSAPSGFDDDSGYLKKRVGERVFSRLVEMCEFQRLTGDDYRRLKR